MAYQQVGTPRFYVDAISWLKSLGVGNSLTADIWGFNTSNLYTGEEGGGDRYFTYTYNSSLTIPYNFVAYLGHTFLSDSSAFDDIGFIINTGDESGEDWILPDNDSVEGSVNFNDLGFGGNNGTASFNGFSIVRLQEITENHHSVGIHVHNRNDLPYQLGTVVVGSYYDMPHSPDLNLSLSYDYSGVKEITTRGGASLSNSFYSKPADWGSLGAWELSDGSTPNQELSRSGRKVWNLSFSYLAQEDTFPKYDQLNMLATSTPDETQPDQYTLQGSDDFYTQVIHKTNGGQLPFIFQPNKDENSFAICKIDSGFSVKLVANGVYNIKMKIREVW